MSGDPPSGDPDASPPFDPLTFNYLDIPERTRMKWCLKPPIVIADPDGPYLAEAKSPYEYYRRMIATYVSPAVFELGENPYPGLHRTRHIRELQTDTPQYSATSPWMGANDILMYITPNELQQLGCINLETSENPNIEISPRFQVDTAALATASRNRSIRTITGNNDGIHPCFRRHNWRRTSDAEYEYLKPVLRIATEMMAMDGFLDLWTALGQPLHRLPLNNMLRDQNEHHRVYYTGRTSPAQRGRTKQEMTTLDNFVSFSWKHSDGSSGSTQALVDRRGLRLGTTQHASHIELDTYLRHIICCRGAELSASHYNPAATNVSAYMRTQLFLANTIVHELTHAWFENVTDEAEQISPFRNDDRIGEEGHAAETMIHKNVILDEMETNLSVSSMPFGLRADRWPGIKVDEDYATRATAAKHGIKFDTSYAVPMTYVHQFFLDDFWNNRILRFGDGALNNYKAVGVRRCTSGELEFSEFESPTVRTKRDPATGALEEDPEIESDAEFPDVDKGIIYPDKVLTFMGGEMSDSDEEMQDGDESGDGDGDEMVG